MAIVHFHFCPNKDAGDTRRVKNIDNYVANKLSDKIIEVQFYSVWQRRRVLSLPYFTISEHVSKKYMVPLLFKYRLVRDWYSSLRIALICRKYKAEYVIGEFSTSSYAMRLMKLISPNTKLIVDVHGAVAEEYKYGNPSFNEKWYRTLITDEKRSFETTDYIICQSEEMKRYICDNSNCKSNKIAVFKCGVDTELFYIDTNARKQLRNELEFADNDVVFVYSGAIQKWQKIESTLHLFADYHAYNKNSKLLILTREVEQLNHLLEAEQLEYLKESMVVRSLTLNEVPKYLNAADVAFLIRDNAIMNAVASPTKLAEYLACGLPIISSEVSKKWTTPEASEFIIYSDGEENINEKIESIVRNSDKNRISEYAKANLSIEEDLRNINRIFFGNDTL